ncbi:MAG: Gfo/Idh/MocA family oxidoreductase [Acidobacteriota bacterium]|nr:Gfo/Idh/MocA family oxidoreductase [Acidobacteriota bacterium]
MANLRWGILGTARINRRLIPAIRAARRSSLEAVASRDRARAEAFAREWEIPQAVEGYQRLLENPSIDAVYIPLPNSEHVKWTLAAIAAGKHVLCEKPLALDPAHVDQIATAARAAKICVEEGFMYRHEPLTARVLELVRSGALGAVRAIVSGFTYTRTGDNDVRLDPALGGGALWDIGCYPVTYARLIADRDPKMVFGSAHWTAGGIDEEFMGLLRFPGGATATIYAGFIAASRTWLEVLGSDGALTVPNPFRPGPLETLELERAGQVERIDVTGSPEIFVREVEHFEASVLDGAPPVVSLAESRGTAASLSALYASARDSTSGLRPVSP